MIVRRIKMVNFRGFREKTIEFHDKPVVLSFAANGVGKTTTVDAIEWCLTGNIGRLRNVFDLRSTNDPDRKMNTDGILKNREAKPKAKVSVSLTLFDGEREIMLQREQTADMLDPSLSRLTVNGEAKGADAFLQAYVGDSFYNFHVFDVQKTYNIQSTKRKNLKDLFSEFITNYEKQKQIADNLEIFSEDVTRCIQDKTAKMVKSEEIQRCEKQLEQVQGKADRVPYPKDVFYSDETVDIAGLSKEALKDQKSKLADCGYIAAKEYLKILSRNEAAKREQSTIQKLVLFWENKSASIQRAVQAGLWQNSDIIQNRESRLEQLEQLSLSRNTIFADAESLLATGSASFTKDEFEADKNAITQKAEKVEELSAEIDLLGENNALLQQLSSLCAIKQAVLDYRSDMLLKHGTVRCPVCGSEAFAEAAPETILLEAEKYIARNGALVKHKTEERTALKAEIDRIYRKIIACAKETIEQKKASLTAEISAYRRLSEETQPYFDLIKALKTTRKELRVEELSFEKVKELQASVNKELLAEPKEKELTEAYQRLLKVLGYPYETETIEQTYFKVSGLIRDQSIALTSLPFEILVAKLNAIDSVLSNQEAAELNQFISEAKDRNNRLSLEITQLNALKEKADARAGEIRRIIEELSKEEYEKVGPSLFKFYNKLSRVNTSENIRIVPENEGISLVDEKNKNIVNILSSGQLSVFILAYFFAGINARNEREKMKVFFVDDMTACMDDVNMLAFMDLLKYQMSAKRTMDQLFFSTCDERISSLLKYKMDGHGIELCELRDADFV